MVDACMPVRRARLRIERASTSLVTARRGPQHLFQHMIAADAEAVVDELHVGVAIAEMPGEPHEIARRPSR